MATQMTNTVPGIVTFTQPIAMHCMLATGSKYDNVDKSQVSQGIQLVKAVQGTWTTNATGTDGKITVTSILPVNEDQLMLLRNSVILDTAVASTTSLNIAAVQ